MQAFLASLSERESRALGHALELIVAGRPEIASLRSDEATIAELPPVEARLAGSHVTETEPPPQKGATP